MGLLRVTEYQPLHTQTIWVDHLLAVPRGTVFPYLSPGTLTLWKWTVTSLSGDRPAALSPNFILGSILIITSGLRAPIQDPCNPMGQRKDSSRASLLWLWEYERQEKEGQSSEVLKEGDGITKGIKPPISLPLYSRLLGRPPRETCCLILKHPSMIQSTGK